MGFSRKVHCMKQVSENLLIAPLVILVKNSVFYFGKKNDEVFLIYP